MMIMESGEKSQIAIEKIESIFAGSKVIYPKDEINRIEKLIKEVENERKNGNTKVYDEVDQAFKDMGIDIDESI